MSYRKSYITQLIIVFGIICSNSLSYSQQNKRLNQQGKSRIIETCLDAFKEHYIYPDVVVKIEKFVKNKLERGQYSRISSRTALTRQLRKDFRQVSDDRHIWIDVMENLPIQDSNVSIEEVINEKRKSNFGFTKVEIMSGNIGYLLIDNFNDAEYAAETATKELAKLANTDAIIIDLRNNHGGHGNMVRHISSYFFEEKTQLNSLYWRKTDKLVEDWTDPAVPGEKLIKQKLYILTSINTSSAAESFSCTMKNYKRATIIGERTRGAAHWKETYKFPDQDIFLEIPVARPINPVTKKGWEGVGVKPDIAVSERLALDRALKLARERK
ncbi:MAG: S41 family peptidase [bacterium]|nr:S41 family peptidase [bacterium]